MAEPYLSFTFAKQVWMLAQLVLTRPRQATSMFARSASLRKIDEGNPTKTSVIEVQDMLSVLGVDELETRICEVTGIESATVDFAAGNATVRYDETRIQMADIKSAVRQRGYESAAAAGAAERHDHQSHTGPGTPAAPAPAPPKPAPVAPATAVAASVGGQQDDKGAPLTTSKPSPPPPISHTGDEQNDKNGPKKE